MGSIIVVVWTPVSSEYSDIGKCAFHACRAFLSVVIPSSVTQIAQFAFST